MKSLATLMFLIVVSVALAVGTVILGLFLLGLILGEVGA